jgi:methionyl-tRNA formyltransferase
MAATELEMSTLTLYLMTEKGLTVLSRLADEGMSKAIGRVVVASDKAVQKDYRTEIEALASSLGIPCSDRQSAPPPADHAIAIGWRWLIRPADKLIVLHDSLLPRYRGFSPLVSALINGDAKVGATALFASEEFDRGPVIAQAAIDVVHPLTIQQAISKVCGLYASLVVPIVATLARGDLPVSSAQDEERATYSVWRDDDDYTIDWSDDAARIERFVDAVGYPYLGAATRVGDETYRVLEARALPDVVVENRVAGKVLFVRDGHPVVVCGRGLIAIRRMVDADGANALPLSRMRTRFS